MGISAYYHRTPDKLSDAEEGGVCYVFAVDEAGDAHLIERYENINDYCRDYEKISAKRLQVEGFKGMSVVTIVDSGLDDMDEEIEDDIPDPTWDRITGLAAKTAQLHESLPLEQRGRIALHLHDADLAPMDDVMRHHGYSVYGLYTDGRCDGLTGPMEGTDYEMNFKTVKANAASRGDVFAGMVTFIDGEGAGYDMEDEFETEDEFAEYEMAEDELYTKMMHLADAAITGKPLILPAQAPDAPELDSGAPGLDL